MQKKMWEQNKHYQRAAKEPD